MAFASNTEVVASSGSSHGTGGFTSGAFTPTADSLLVVVVNATEDSGSTDPSGDLSISDSLAGSWTPIANVGNATPWSFGMRAFYQAVGGSPASMTVTVDCGARNVFRYLVRAFCITGHRVASPIVQTSTDTVIATNGADTMSAFAGSVVSGNLVFSVLCRTLNPGATSVVTPGTSWTELFDDQHDPSLGQALQGQYRTDLSDTTAGVWNDTEASGATCDRAFALSFEVAAVAASGPPLAHRRAMLYGRN